MVASLEQYVAEATQAYQPTQTAIQNQINALSGQLESTNKQINKNYAQQQAGLNRQRNMAAENASMQAAGSGGSFGGAANIANRKYYDQSFVPAQTQLQTNQANELERARQDSENQRLNYQTHLANLETPGRQSALNQYYDDQQLEKQLEEQRRATAAQNAYNQYMLDAIKKQNSGYNLSSTRNMYGGFDWTDAQGNKHKVSTVAASAAGTGQGNAFNESLWDALSLAGQQGDYYSQVVAKEISNGARFARNGTGKSTGNSMYDTLGIYRVN